MFNFLSGLIGFICQDKFFQFSVMFSPGSCSLASYPGNTVSQFFPSNVGWTSPAEGWAVPCRIQVHSWNNCGVETYPGVHPAWICKGFQCYLAGFLHGAALCFPLLPSLGFPALWEQPGRCWCCCITYSNAFPQWALPMRTSIPATSSPHGVF